MVVSRPQLESGYTFTRTDGVSRHSVGELLLRLGVSRHVELRVGANSFVVTRARTFTETGTGAINTTAVEDISLGAKVGLSPDAAIIITAGLPTGSASETADGVVPDILLSLSRDLGEIASVGLNSSVASQPGPGGRRAEASGSIAFGLGVSATTGLFAEAYGTRVLGAKNALRPHSVYADAGITRKLTPDVQLDARVGRRLNADAEWFAGVGLVTRW